MAIFLDWWDYDMSNRYSFAVFEQDAEGAWQQAQSRVEDINAVVAVAICALAERALLSGASSEPTADPTPRERKSA